MFKNYTLPCNKTALFSLLRGGYVSFILRLSLAIFLFSLTSITVFADFAHANRIDDNLAIRAIIGEAGNQGYRGMLAVAVGIRNRGSLQGVYGLQAKHVDKEPQWVFESARRAWKESAHNHLHRGTHWENIKAFGKPKWAEKMKLVYQYKDHNFYAEK